ncbi:MAG: methyltransferase domain-containing protein [Methanoregula sp.]
MTVKEFYTEMYGEKTHTPDNLGFLYKKLKKYAITRDEMCYMYAPNCERVLVVGCGNGELLFKLKEKCKWIFAIDIVDEQIKKLQNKIRDDPSTLLIVADANERLDFEDNFFDAIVASAVLQQLFDPYFFFKECRRLLRDNGTLIINVPNVAFFPNRFRLLFGLLPITSNQRFWDGGHLHYFTRNTLKQLFLDMGFEVSIITHGGIFGNFRKIWGSLFCGDILIVGIKK